MMMMMMMMMRNRRRRQRRPLAVSSFLLAAAAFAPSSARAQVRGAIDVDQGVHLPGSYALNLLAVPGYDFGPIRLAVDVGATLENPKWAFIAGMRPSFVLWSPVTPETGVRFMVDWSYMSLGGWRGLGGILVDLDSVHLGVSVGYDSFRDGEIVLTTIGVDVFSLVPFLASNPFGSTPPCGQ